MSSSSGGSSLVQDAVEIIAKKKKIIAIRNQIKIQKRSDITINDKFMPDQLNTSNVRNIFSCS